MRYPFASMMISEIAPRLGIRAELEPEFGFAGELFFPNGKRHLFRNTNFNINPAGSTEIARDKGYTNFFLRKHGFNVAEGQTFFSDRLCSHLAEESRRGIADALAYAEVLNYPVFVKPNNLSQGVLVTKVYTAGDLERTALEIFNRTNVMLVEKPCPGNDYRIVVLGDEIISAYQRCPLAITGDGTRTIQELLEQKKAQLDYKGRPNSEINVDDDRIDLKLNSLAKDRAHVLPAGEKLAVLDNANLSTGGTSIDVTANVHPSFLEIAVAATKTLGLHLCGVDLLTDDITLPANKDNWTIIELNAAPGLDNYASLGDEQRERVKTLYSKILLYLADH